MAALKLGRDATIAARALSIMASDRRWTLDEIIDTLVDSQHRNKPRRVAFRTLARAMCRPGLTSAEARAEAEASLRSRRRR